MAWSATKKGILEARLDGIAAKLVANLTALNTAFTQDGMWTASVPITASMVRVGDVEDLPAREIAPILMCVEAAPNDASIRRDTMSGLEYTTGQVHEVETHLYFYIHPQAITDADYEAYRERALSRLCDWATAGTLNTKTGQRIVLESNVYHPDGEFDTLVGMVTEVERDWYLKEPGRSVRVRGARLVHKGYVG